MSLGTQRSLFGRLHDLLRGGEDPRASDRGPRRERRPGPWRDGSMHPESLLMVTLDSCRFDTFAAADIPNLRAVGPVHRAFAPAAFTYGSHSAMFVGFTPGDPSRAESIVNPKHGKLFRLDGGGTASRGTDRFLLSGRTAADGFRRAGHLTAATGAVRWFDSSTAPSLHLTQDFAHWYFPGDKWYLRRQLAWLQSVIAGSDRPVFAFLNVGETHTPYWHEGAAWTKASNPCKPHATDNDAGECRRRQRACLEFADGLLGPMLRAFSNANILVCGDHGDAWGEDGLWEHGFHHPKVLEVPLVFRTSPPAGR